MAAIHLVVSAVVGHPAVLVAVARLVASAVVIRPAVLVAVARLVVSAVVARPAVLVAAIHPVVSAVVGHPAVLVAVIRPVVLVAVAHPVASAVGIHRGRAGIHREDCLMADVLQEAIHLVGSNSTGTIHGITASGRDMEGAGRMPGGDWAGDAPGVAGGV